MTNPFSTDALVPSWAAVGVLKGDFVGHPFRGNQYTAGQLVGKSKELVSNHGKGADDVGQLVNLPHLAGKLADGHLEVAHAHTLLASKAFAENQPEVGQAHLKAAAAHTDVAHLFTNALHNPEAPAGSLNRAQGAAWTAHTYTEKAAETAGEPVAKTREQSSHHKDRAKRHRKTAALLFTNGFLHASSLHSQAATAHDNAAEATKGEDNTAYGDAIEAANDASSAAESASAAVSTGYATTSNGTSGE
jgi:hypothetical protein